MFKELKEMKLNKLLQARKVLGKHANEPIPTLLAYKILKFMKASDTEGAFYDDKLKDIIMKYGERDESGNLVNSNAGVNIARDKIEECENEIKELDETDVEKPQITFTIQELTPINFSVSELYSLDELIEEN